MWQPRSASTFFFFLGYRGIVHPPSADEGTERTWQQAQWRHIWELASASYLDRRHRVLWWRLLHCSLMCGAYKSYIGRATPTQANCPFSCCISPSQPQTISHLFLTCPVAATVTDWLCRLWQAMTGYMPVVSIAGLLAADTSSEQLPSDALLQTWHSLMLAVLHSIWTASQIAQASQPTQPSDTSEADAILAPSPSSQQASLSSSTSRHGHLARQLVLKTVKAMIHNDWTKCNDNICCERPSVTGGNIGFSSRAFPMVISVTVSGSTDLLL